MKTGLGHLFLTRYFNVAVFAQKQTKNTLYV